MVTFESLSDRDFEDVIGDLLGAEYGCTYESFARGADAGVDLRYVSGSDLVSVVQCKHMEGSSVSQLRSQVKKEAARWVDSGAVKPKYYYLATSKALSRTIKDEFAETLSVSAQEQVTVLASDDIRSLLRKHPTVERAHIKLWLSSPEHMKSIVDSAINVRSESLLSNLPELLRYFVATASFDEARRQLMQDRVLVISGPPGIGKSTIAKMLSADLVTDGYSLYVISADASEADQVYESGSKQVFYYDDFLGTNVLRDRISKNADKRLTDLMGRCARSVSHFLILTTREYILQDALQWYEELTRSGLPLRKYLLELQSYSRYDKARIFANHVEASVELTARAVSSVMVRDRYKNIINHPNFSPRIVEYLTGRSFFKLGERELNDYYNFTLESLGDPNIVWTKAFEAQIEYDSRLFIVAVAAAEDDATWSTIMAYYYRVVLESGQHDLKSADVLLKHLQDSFLITKFAYGEVFVTLANPGLNDMAAHWLTRNVSVAQLLVDGAIALQQVAWVVRHVFVDVPQFHKEQMGYRLWGAMLRLWDSPPLKRAGQFVYADAWAGLRLNLALTIYSHLSEDADRFDWLQNQINLAPQALAREPFFPELYSRIVLRSSKMKFDVQVLSTVIVDKCLSEAQYIDAWLALADIHSELPTAFAGQSMDEIASLCEEWAIDELSRDIVFYKGEGDIEDVLDVAEVFGVELSSSLVKSAYAELSLDDLDFSKLIDRPREKKVGAPANEEYLIESLMAETLRRKLDLKNAGRSESAIVEDS